MVVEIASVVIRSTGRPEDRSKSRTIRTGTMSPKLKPLLLPQLVEERRKRESLSDSTDLDLSSSYLTQSSSASDISAPVTPTFPHSPRSHARYSSSTSSLDLPMHPPVADSGPSSPTTKSSKRSLPDLQEEPQEQDEDFDMFDDYAYDYCYGKSVHLIYEYLFTLFKNLV